MYIFCRLTPAGRFQNKWVSPQAKFILEIKQGPGCTSKKKGCTTCKGCSDHPLDYSEYFVKMVLCHLYGTLTQPRLSFSKKNGEQ